MLCPLITHGCRISASFTALACQVQLLLSIQIQGVMLIAIYLKIGLDSTMSILAGDRQHSIHLDGQTRTQVCLHSVNAFLAATAKHDDSTSSQEWPQIQNPKNGLMGSKQSGSLNILVLGLALVGMDPCTVSPESKRGQ